MGGGFLFFKKLNLKCEVFTLFGLFCGVLFRLFGRGGGDYCLENTPHNSPSPRPSPSRGEGEFSGRGDGNGILRGFLFINMKKVTKNDLFGSQKSAILF